MIAHDLRRPLALGREAKAAARAATKLGRNEGLLTCDAAEDSAVLLGAPDKVGQNLAHLAKGHVLVRLRTSVLIT